MQNQERSLTKIISTKNRSNESKYILWSMFYLKSEQKEILEIYLKIGIE